MTEVVQPPAPITLTDEWTKQHMARAVPGAYWSKDAGAWQLDSPTPRTAAIILRLFPELAREHPSLSALRDELANDVRPFDNATPFNQPLTDTLAELYEFQATDLFYLAAVLQEHKGAYIGWERGLGKTLGTARLIEELGSQRTLVVCPNTAKESVWAAELDRWLPSHDVLVLPNNKIKRERMLESLRGTGATGRGGGKNPEASRRTRGSSPRGDSSIRPLVLVIHYEALALIAGKTKTKSGRGSVGDGWKAYGEWDLFVADEAHRLKNTDALMSKAAKKVPAAKRLALSGSIIENHAEEMFSVLQWLHPKTYKAKWRDWNDRFLDYAEGAYGKICLGVKVEQLDNLRRELGVFMVYRRKRDELPGLPPKTEQTMLVDLGKAQRKAYNELRDEFLTRLEDESVVKASDGLVLLTRLRQVATGLDLVSEDVTDSVKLDVVYDMLLDESDAATVVFSWFKQPCVTLHERLAAKGIDAFMVTGDTKHATRAEVIARFQAGEGQVFIGTLSTLGESVNLQRASNAIFIDRSWNPALNEQAADRIYRIGQTKPVTVTHLVARDTVDEYRVLPALANKEALRRMILGGM